MKIIKIVLIIGVIFICNLITAQGSVATIRSGYSRPVGGDVRFRLVSVKYKIYSNGALVGNFEARNDQGFHYSRNFPSAQPITRIEVTVSVTNSTNIGNFSCTLEENIILSGNDRNCFERTFTNGACIAEVKVVNTQNLLTQPVNDTFCLDDGLRFTQINDCTNASYQWFYNIDNTGNFRDTGVTTKGNQAAVIPFGRLIPRGYRGSIRLRARTIIGQGTYDTNIVIFRTLPCAPEIGRVTPISASCGRSNGGLTISFREPVNQQMLFVIRENGRPVESVQQYVSGSNFTWPANRGLRSGRYTLTYQPFPGEVINYNRPIVIGDTPKVSFSAVKNNDVICFGQDIGRITITASRGNGRYQYRVNDGPWKNFANGNRHVLSGLARGNYRIEVRDNSGCVGETSNGNTGENVFINGPRNGVIFSNIRVTPITYRGDNTGAINLAVSGGSRPYRYQWSNGSTTEDISQLRAGFYTLTVTDAKDCVFPSQPIEVPEPDALQVRIATRQVISCNGDTNGHLEAIPSGGTASAGYEYQWTKIGDPTFNRTTKSINNLSPGTYSVTLSNIGAPSTSNNEELINPGPLAITPFQIQDIKCFGELTGAIRFNISGGRPPYTVTWDNGVIQTTNGAVALVNQPKGIYNFEVLDTENCPISNNAPITIKEEDEIIIGVSGLGIQGPTSVNGTNGALDIIVSGGTRPGTYTYAWTSDQFAGTRTTEDLSNLTEGIYNLTVRDANDCAKTRVFELKDPEPLEVSIRVDDDILCFGQKANLTAIVKGGVTNSAQSYSYQWYVAESGVPIELTGETNQTITGLDEGIYEVKATDIVDISKTSDTKSFVEPTEILLDGTHKNILCHGGNNGSIDIIASGGIPPLAYEWTKLEDPTFLSLNEDLTNITFGTYTVIVRDANLVCKKEKTFVVEQPEDPVEIIGFSKENVKIFGESTGSISITVNGGTPNYIYKWTKLEDLAFLSTEEDLIDINIGTYTVEITDINVNATTSNIGCKTVKDFIITQPDKLEVSISIGNPLDCFGFSNGVLEANAIGGIEDQDYSYQWFEIINGNETKITTDPTEAFKENLKKGTYKVLVEDVNGAKATDIFDLKEPEKIVASLVGKTDVKCFGEFNGTIRFHISGGTPFDDNTYIVELSKDGNFYTSGSYEVGELLFDRLPIGSYEITVQDKNGCPAIEVPDPIKIEQPDTLEIAEAKVTDLTGFETQNGTITITIAGGTREYRYEWRRESETTVIGTDSIIGNLPIGNYEVTVLDANDCKIDGAYTLIQPDKLEVVVDYPIVGGRISCNGVKNAILEAAVIGGVPFDKNTANPYYQYEWYSNSNPSTVIGTNQILEDIGKGNYFVIITDANNNITKSSVFEVTEPTAIDIKVTSKSDVLCFNDASGTITVEVSGGTPFDDGTYVYTWSNGVITKDVSNLLAGNYVLTVTDKNGCKMDSEIITINEPNPLALGEVTRIPPSTPNSRDGSITINVINGTPPYTYQWFDERDRQYAFNTNRINNTGNEQYFVTVTDANRCSIEKRNIDDPFQGLSVNVIQINPVLCQGSNTASLRANATGGIPFSSNPPYMYTWFEEGNPNPIGSGKILYELPIGSYYVTIEDVPGNTIQSKVYKIVGPPVELEVTLKTDYINCGDLNDWTITPTVIGGVPPYTYFWENGFSSDQELTGVPSGTYTLVIQDTRGCIAQKSISTFSPVPLEAEVLGTNPKCYQTSTGFAEVIPSGGVPPYTFFWNTNETTSEISELPAGDYFIEITDSKGCAIIKEVTLVDPDEIFVDIGRESKILCQGQTYTIDASIDDPDATYKWTSDKGFESFNAEVTLSEEANYQIEITTGLGCIASTNLAIIVRESPLIAEFLLSSDVFVNKSFVLANVSYPKADRVEWVLPEKAQIVNIDDTYAEIQFSEIGEYDVSMTVYFDGCEETFIEKIIVRDQSILSGDDTGNFLQNFTIYPIPTDGNFTIEIEFKEVAPISFNIYSLVSNTPVLSKTYEDSGASNYAIPMNLKRQNLPPGVYFIILEIPGKRYIHKIIIE